MPRKKKNGAPAEQPISKVAFVKSLPPETAVTDVVAKAKAAGIEISKNYVYLIRSQGGAKGGTAKRKGRPPSKTKVAVAPRATSASSRASGSLEVQFGNLVAEIGLARAEDLLRGVRAKFTSAARA
jgi:hypothetical protein